jgi:hypothetical protein
VRWFDGGYARAAFAFSGIGFEEISIGGDNVPANRILR